MVLVKNVSRSLLLLPARTSLTTSVVATALHTPLIFVYAMHVAPYPRDVELLYIYPRG